MTTTDQRSRFDYVMYDDQSRELQAQFKEQFERLEFMVQGNLRPSRATALILTHLEGGYLWVGKAIRDDQIARQGREGQHTELQEGRDTS